jgi:DNA-binding SARP family transcriptional activator/DNA-binding beta-propeller fold protein YncE
MEFKVLGPLEVCREGRALELGAARHRALLADLLLHANEVVSIDRLVEDLWGERPPHTAEHILQVYVSRVRKIFRDGDGDRYDGLLTTASGYLLRIEDPDRLDADTARDLIARGRNALEARSFGTASTLLREAVTSWRGPTLGDLAYESFARAEAERLDELRISAIEDRFEADLALGRHREVAAEAPALIVEFPLREGLRAASMLALYRSGRQAESLAAYTEFSRSLAEELGVDPTPRLRELHRSILRQDSGLDLRAEAPAEALAPEPSRATSNRSRRRRTWARRRLVVSFVLLTTLVVTAVPIVSTLRSSTSSPDVRPNSVAVLDMETGRILGDVPVGAHPSALAFDGRWLWVANFAERTVSKVDPASDREIGRFGGVGIPTAIAVGDGLVWLADPFHGTIFGLDPASGSVVKRFGGVEDPVDVAYAFGSLWAVDPSYDIVARIDPSSGERAAIIRLPRGSGPSAVAAGAGAIWVADELRNAVSRIDPTTDEVAVGSIALCCAPSDIAAGRDRVWVSSVQGDRVAEIDPVSESVVLTAGVGDRPAAIAEDRGGAWVANAGDPSVWHLDAGGTVLAKIAVNGSPADVLPAGGLIMCATGPGSGGQQLSSA